MKKLLLILILFLSNSVSADTGSSYVLKIEICTTNDEIINGFVKTNDYFIDRYLNNEITEPFKDFIIRTVHFTRESGKFTYFQESIHYSLEPNSERNIGFDLYKLKKEVSIPNERIKSISIIEKYRERNNMEIITNLDIDNQFWLSKKPIEIRNIGGFDEYCGHIAVFYILNEQIEKELKENWNIDKYENVIKAFKQKETAIIIRQCSE